LIDTYWERIGGRPQIPQTTPGRKRRTLSPGSETGPKRQRRQGQTTSTTSRPANPSLWTPPADLESWDDAVSDIDDVEKTDTGLILVYLRW
jgi:hypothetical protein